MTAEHVFQPCRGSHEILLSSETWVSSLTISSCFSASSRWFGSNVALKTSTSLLASIILCCLGICGRTGDFFQRKISRDRRPRSAPRKTFRIATSRKRFFTRGKQTNAEFCCGITRCFNHEGLYRLKMHRYSCFGAQNACAYNNLHLLPT